MMELVMYAGIVVIRCIIGVIVGIWAWKIFNWVWLKPKKLENQLRQQGLKGNPYRFITGDMKDRSKMRTQQKEKPIPFTNDYFRRIFPFLHQQLNKYGKNCFIWLGPTPTINITDPKLIREALTKMNEFQKAKLNPIVGLLAPGLATYEGEKWAMHRKLVNPAFHMEKLKLMVTAFSISISETINAWEKTVSGRGGSVEIDVWPYLTTLSADVISRAAFGSSYQEGRRIFELLKEQSNITAQFFQSVYVPGWMYVPTKNNRRMKLIEAEIQRLLKGIIDKRRKAMEAGQPATDDLLGILMESNFKQTQSHKGNKKFLLSFQDLIDECKQFYLAGQETTSVLLVWTMILLSKHQDWQERAREEVLAKFGKDQPDFDGLNQLETVTMILHEVLRLYPPLHSVSRRVYNDGTKLGELYVPNGAVVSLIFLHVHHDPRLWGDDALEFKPQRFSEGIAKATNGNVSYFPFGWGPRICIGQNFAMVEAKMALSMLLQRFSFELSPSYTHAPTNMMILQPQHGAHIIFRRL